MASRPTFLTRRFGGYLHRDVLQEDAELTHVGPNTTCGEYLRCYWQPVCFAIVEAIGPNLQQVAPGWEDGLQEHPFSGPMMSRWIVPQDDTHTMLVEFRHVSETEGVTPSWFADCSIILPGRFAADSYEASQRQPGDYEAQVGQRPIAIHALEHLGATDRGVTMFRQHIRRGIRSVQDGYDPAGLCRDAGTVIPTYANDTVVRVPPAATPAEDPHLLRETGRRLAEAYLKDPPLAAVR